MTRDNKLLILIIFLVSGFIIRLYPAMDLNLPFSIDSWPLIRDVEVLTKYSPIPLDSELFDGYNNYWPGIIIFSSVASVLIGSSPLHIMALLIPFVSSLGLILLYVLLRKLGFTRVISIFSIGILSFVYPHSFFMAGVTKETFAFPLYLTLMLAITGARYRSLIIVFPLILFLVITHHLTSLIAFIVLIAVFISLIIHMADKRFILISFIACILLGLSGYIHYTYFGFMGLSLPELNYSSIISFISYFIVFLFLAYLIENRKGYSRKAALTNFILALIFVSGLVYISIHVGISEYLIKLPGSYIIYALPYIGLGSLLTLGVNFIRRHTNTYIALYWLASVTAFAAYSVFGDQPMLAGISYRILNFLLVPLLIIGVSGVSIFKKRSIMIGFIIILAVSIPSISAFINAYYRSDNYLGYHWKIKPSLYISGEWVDRHSRMQIVTGDMVINNLFHKYFNLNFQYDTDILMEPKRLYNMLLTIYREIYINGYVTSSWGRLPINNDALLQNSLIYNNFNVEIYTS